MVVVDVVLCLAQVGYGSLFDVAKGKGGTGGGGMLFSPKLTRAEALARFRRRFHVPLEWEELAGDTAQGAYPLGGRLGRSALHHTLWGMLVDRWMAEEAVRRDGGEPEPFSGFVVNQLLFKFGTRPLAQVMHLYPPPPLPTDGVVVPVVLFQLCLYLC